MTYTKGPWYAEPAHDGTFELYARTPKYGTQLLGEFYAEDMGDDLPALDNLMVAAAAPSLLEALEELVGEELGGDANADNATRETDFYRPCISWAMRHRARAAIALARGEAGK